MVKPPDYLIRLVEELIPRFYPVSEVMKVVSGPPAEPEIIIGGKRFLLFCSPNYLSLANHPKVCQAGIEAITSCGMGTVGSALVSGYLDLYKALEKKIAFLVEKEEAMVFNSVSLVNKGVITSVMDPPLAALAFELFENFGMTSRAIFFDKANHASLYDALRLLRGVDIRFYPHGDMNRLEDLLKRSDHKTKLIVTDGYFSVDADTAALDVICHLAEKNGAMIFVDDAHANGVLGENGRGTAELYGVEERIDFSVGSLAKAFGVRGGFIASSKKFIDYLRISSRGYMFSGTLPPAVPAACLAAIEVAEEEPWRRKRVLQNAEILRQGLKELGFSVLGKDHIVPWLIGDDMIAHEIYQRLYEEGIFAPAMRYPVLEKGKAIIRFMVMADHREEHLKRAIGACQEIGYRYDLAEI